MRNDRAYIGDYDSFVFSDEGSDFEFCVVDSKLFCPINFPLG